MSRLLQEEEACEQEGSVPWVGSRSADGQRVAVLTMERLLLVVGEIRRTLGVDMLVSGAEGFLRKVAARGARKIGFVGMPPVGCVPSQRTLGGGLCQDCKPNRNHAAQLYNHRVQEMIADLNADDPATLVVFHGCWRGTAALGASKAGVSYLVNGVVVVGNPGAHVLATARARGFCDELPPGPRLLARSIPHHLVEPPWGDWPHQPPLGSSLARVMGRPRARACRAGLGVGELRP